MAFEFAYYNRPIFWTHNSEDKPNKQILDSLRFTKLPKCSVSFIDNFTIRTVLPKSLNATILKISDTNAPLTQRTKYYLLNRTNKVLADGYEYEGILDAWLTYAIPFIEWTQAFPNANRYPVLINRFLNNRIYNRYITYEAYRKADEYFNFDNEELNLIGANEQKIYSSGSKIYVNNDKDFFNINTIKPTTQYDPPDTLSKVQWYPWNNETQGDWDEITMLNQRQPLTGSGNILFKLYVFQMDTTIERISNEAGTYFILCVPIGKQPSINIKLGNRGGTYQIKSVPINGSLLNISDLWKTKLKGVYYFPLWKYINFGYDGTSFYLCKHLGSSAYRLFFTMSASSYLKFHNELNGNYTSYSSFSPTEIFRPNLLSTTYNDTTNETKYNYGFFFPTTSGRKSTTTRIDYGTSYKSFNNIRADIIEQGSLGRDPTINRESSTFYLTKKISRYPTGYNILNSYALSRAKVLGAYLNPSFKRIIKTIGTADKYFHTGSYGYLAFNGLNFIVQTPWNNSSAIYESFGSMNAFIDGYSIFLNESKASMNAQLTIAKQRSDLASAEAVLGGISGLAKNTGKLLVGTGTGNVGMTAQGAIGFASGVGTTVTGVIRAQQMYSHAKLSQEAMLVDKRNSALGQTITSNYTDDDYKQKFIFNNGYYLRSAEASYGYNGNQSGTMIDYNSITYTFYDFALLNAPLSLEGVNFYNRLTWDVGMKANFYMPISEIFKPDYGSQTTRWYNNNSIYIRTYDDQYLSVTNPFVYLSLDIPDLYYREFAPYATLEEIEAIKTIFSSGVRIWIRAPRYTDDDDAFYILDTNIIYGRRDPETNETLIYEDEIALLPEYEQELTNVKTKKRSKRK